MILVVFDIDGTLTDTNSVDTQCFAESLLSHFDLPGLNSNWDSYISETDSGLAFEVIRNAFGREVTSGELLSLQETFFELLRARFSADPTCCKAVRGAPEFLNLLLSYDEIAVAFATAGWRQSALLKLTHSGIDIRDSILRTSSEHPRKIDAMRSASKETLVRYGISDFEAEVYIGDSPRDYRFATELGMKFVGIGDHFQERRDLTFSAFLDFADTDAIIEIIQSTEQDAAANP